MVDRKPKRPLATPTTEARRGTGYNHFIRDSSGRFASKPKETVAKSKPLDLNFLVDPRKTVNPSVQSKVDNFNPPRNQKRDPDGWKGFLEDSLEPIHEDEWEKPGAGMLGCMHDSKLCHQSHNPYHFHLPDNPLLAHTIDTLKGHWRHLSNELAACNAQIAKASYSKAPFLGEITTKIKITHLEKARQEVEARLQMFKGKVGSGWKIPEWVKLVAGDQDSDIVQVWDAWLKKCTQVDDSDPCEICGTGEWYGPRY